MDSSDRSSLHPLTTHWNNRNSLCSIISDTPTFHSAHAHQSHMELSQLDSPQLDSTKSTPSSSSRPRSPHTMASASAPRPHTPQRSKTTPISPQLGFTPMGRQDSGFAEGRDSTSSSRRTSTSSRLRHKSPTKRSPLTTSRPSTKRASRSTPSTNQSRTSACSYRPSLRTRHTTPTAPYQFFQFPTLPSTHGTEHVAATPPPPPATTQYWTSDANRRLEYAAIDAASRGVRGFFIKLVPDCILPASSRRTRFHCDDADSDAGSVRRYRLELPEEKAQGRRPGLLKRWTSFGRKNARVSQST